MTYREKEPKGYTAGQMRRMTACRPRVEPRRPNSYNLTEHGVLTHEGVTFREVTELCDGIGAATLRKRLERGVRSIELLSEKPVKPSERYAQTVKRHTEKRTR